jgi:uncharacterized protein (TIGR03437 family)
MRLVAIHTLLFCAALLPPASAQTATYTNSNQAVTLTGLGGGNNGWGQSRVTWGNCAYNGTNTVCTVTAPYTGVGGGGTINMVLTNGGNGISPWTANPISAGSNYITFGLMPGNSGSIKVSLTENATGATVAFLTDNFVFYYSAPTCSGTAVSTCSVSQVGLTPGAVITGTVYGTFDQTPVIRTSLGVISASAYGGFSALAPGTWMEIYGTNLANVTSQNWSTADFNGNTAPSALGGTTVTIGGQPAFIDYVSPTQVNAQVPSGILPGTQPVVVTTPGGASLPYPITVNVTEPGLLAPAVFNLPAGQYVTALFPDGFTYVLPPGAIAGLASARAVPGNTIVFYGVGFGTVTPNSPAGQIVTQSNALSGNFQASFAGTPATVTFSGLTFGYLGLYQFDVVVPKVAASDTVPFSFSLGGTSGTQTLLIAIGN